MDVESDRRESRHAGKAVRPQGPNPVKAAVPEVVDRRFNRRMLTVQRGELTAPLALPVGFVEIALLRQRVVIEQPVKTHAVAGAVKNRRPLSPRMEFSGRHYSFLLPC